LGFAIVPTFCIIDVQAIKFFFQMDFGDLLLKFREKTEMVALRKLTEVRQGIPANEEQDTFQM
jgi:hypothetical protein